MSIAGAPIVHLTLMLMLIVTIVEYMRVLLTNVKDDAVKYVNTV